MRRASDSLFVVLSVLHGAALLAIPAGPLIALGVWWNSNTIAHNFVHRPFFRSRSLNAGFALWQSLLMGIPQTLWRERHLAHHAGVPWRARWSHMLAAETVLIVASWAVIATSAPAFFALTYLPGYVAGLMLCSLQGHYEHAGALATSHYGRVYNRLCFNDGYHVEHHAWPGVHWSELPARAQPDARSSRWPALLRWIDALDLVPWSRDSYGKSRAGHPASRRGFSLTYAQYARSSRLAIRAPRSGTWHRNHGSRGLEALERLVLCSPLLQRLVIATHRRACRAALADVGPVHRVAIVGGGLFPRTALVLHELLPAAELDIIDADLRNLAIARNFIDRHHASLGRVATFTHARFTAGSAVDDADLLVIPLAYDGDRRWLYDRPPARAVLVHDWLWRTRGRGHIVSVLLLKRVNLVSGPTQDLPILRSAAPGWPGATTEHIGHM